MVYFGIYYSPTETNYCFYDSAAQRKVGLQRMRTAVHTIPAKRFLMARSIIGIISRV
jgi:hypothetical protein